MAIARRRINPLPPMPSLVNVIPMARKGRDGRNLPKTAFEPGKSGNPGGRPRGVMEINALARTYAPEAIERLAYWMRLDDPKVSPAAAMALLNRGCGMPMQATEITGRDGTPLAAPSLNVSFVSAVQVKTEDVKDEEEGNQS